MMVAPAIPNDREEEFVEGWGNDADVDVDAGVGVGIDVGDRVVGDDVEVVNSNIEDGTLPSLAGQIEFC